MNIRFLFVITLLFVSAILAPGSAIPLYRIIAGQDLAPVSGGTLCIGDNDTCIAIDSSGCVVIDFLIADSALITLAAPGYSDTVLAFDSCAVDPVEIVLHAEPVGQGSLSTAGAGKSELAAFGIKKENDSACLVLITNQEIVVAAQRVRRAEDTSRQSLVKFTPDDFNTRAGTVDDLSRYIGSLPSAVSSLGEGYDNTFLVRGGRPTETIFILDGIEMENINHFSKADGSGGPIGFVNTECVDAVNYFAGTMPVSYPSRLSAVVDIGMKSGIEDSAMTTIGCKLTGGMAASRGRFAAGHGAYSFSGRYIDFGPLRRAIKGEGIPRLGDLFGKVTLAANDRVDLSTTGIVSHNRYRYTYPVTGTADDGARFDNTMTNDERILQGGAGVTLRYQSERVKATATASLSFRNGQDADLLGHISDTFYQKRYAANPVWQKSDNRAHYTLTVGSSSAIGAHQSVSAGIRAAENGSTFLKKDESQFSGECVYCDNDKPVVYSVEKQPYSAAATVHAGEASGFIEYTWSAGIIKAIAGIRTDYFRMLDATPSSPRFSFSLHPSRFGTFSGSFGLYHQFPADLPSLLFDFLSSGSGMTGDSLQTAESALLGQLQPERCWQTSMGYDKSLASGIETRFEAYYKWYDREFNFRGPDFQEVLTYDTDGRLRFGDQDGKRKALGVEASIARMRKAGLFYSLAGSLFEVKNRYRDGTWYNDWSDVKYTVSLSVGSRFRSGHTMAFSLQGAGGRPFCPQKITLDCINRKITRYDSSTAFFERRLDPLVSASTRYSFTRRVRGITIESSLEILNAFNYQPTLEYRFNGDRFVAIKPFSITPILGCRVIL